MRHKVVHDYLGVDEDIVWQVAIDDLPDLVASLERLGIKSVAMSFVEWRRNGSPSIQG